MFIQIIIDRLLHLSKKELKEVSVRYHKMKDVSDDRNFIEFIE